MKYSGIGGQAVMEGVMMKNADKYAVAVRKQDKDIVVDVREEKGILSDPRLKKIPILRGIVNFIDSMVIGMQALTYSASFFEEEDDENKNVKNSEAKEKAVTAITVAVSIGLAVLIFMMLPYFLSTVFERFISSHTVVALIEGILRLIIFLAYITLISLMEDMRRVYMYHGAEHKCINCIENGLELNIENVKKSSRYHKRCGTSFILIVLLVTIVFFMFIQVDSQIMRVAYRLLLVPLIAGVSYEFIRLAGRKENPVIEALSKPGLWLQRITTREPDEDMIEVGIASVEAVFDWRKYLAEQGES